jgi:hypothetical protein
VAKLRRGTAIDQLFKGAEMNEVDALRMHVAHLNNAVATTTCRETVDALRQMLREAEAKLRQIDAELPTGTGPTSRP